MFQSKEEQLGEINRKIVLMAILDAPGMIMLALWAYAKFGVHGEPFFPLLANPVVVDGLLICGIAIVILCAWQIVLLALQKARIENDNSFP